MLIILMMINSHTTKDKQEYLRIINLMIQDFIYEIYLKFYDFMEI